MRTTFVPFAAGNPYQRLLATHLRELEVEVDSCRARAHLLAELGFDSLPDVVHLHWLAPFFLSRRWPDSRSRAAARAACLIAELEALKRLGTRVVWTVHNLGNHEKKFPTIDRWCHSGVARVADRIIVHSDAAKGVVERELGVATSRMKVVPHGHYCDWYDNTVGAGVARQLLGLDERHFVFLFFGTIRRYKQVPELIDAFADAELGDDTRLVVCGDPRTKELSDRVQKRSDADLRVHFSRGFVPDELAQIYFNAADVVVLPFEHILTSGSAVLAASFGRALVIPRIETLLESLASEGVVTYEAGGSETLAAALERAYQKRTEIVEMGRANLRRVRNADWPTIARKTRRVYESVLQQ